MKIGTDIVRIERIAAMRERYGDRFLTRFLRDEERALVKNDATLAGFWAAKEAIAKAFGCGIGASLGFHDIVLSKTSNGAPFFRLSDEARRRHPYSESSLSISHDGGFAIAVVAII